MAPDPLEGHESGKPDHMGGNPPPQEPPEPEAVNEEVQAGDDANAWVQISSEAVRAFRDQMSAIWVPTMRRITEDAAWSVLAHMPRVDPAALGIPRVDVSRVIGSAVQDAMQEQGQRLAAQIQDVISSTIDLSVIGRSILPPGWEETRDRFLTEYSPPNWPRDAGLKKFADFIAETGWAIVWLPRSEVIAVLVDAAEADREAALLGHQNEIVEDALDAMGAVEDESLLYLASCVSEVAESISAGHHRAAQGLAASVLTELVQGFRGFKSLKEAREKTSVDPEDAQISEFRHQLIVSTIPKALDAFWRDKGDPIPTRFNRHAVAHTADPIQLTPTNALIGLILIAALVREYQELVDRGLLIEVDDGEDQPEGEAD